MKLIKFYLHSIMCQDWLNSLVMFSTERQLAQELDFKDLIYDFWYKKKQQLWLMSFRQLKYESNKEGGHSKVLINCYWITIQIFMTLYQLQIGILA